MRLVNIAIRLRGFQGDNVLIGGLIISSVEHKRSAVRAIGPSLTAFGVSGALENPTLELYRSADGTLVSTNDDWKQGPNSAEVSSRNLAPGDDRESVIIETVLPGG